MTADETRRAIQQLLHVADDGVFGDLTMSAMAVLAHANADVWPVPAAPDGAHEVKATSFADPADVRAFRQCKAGGNSDQFCFRKGDNGLGFGKYDCTAGSGPACALPPEFWAQFPDARDGKRLVKITNDANGLVLICPQKDTMPHLPNIANGAGIDLNSDACAALKISVPADARVTWEWVQ